TGRTISSARSFAAGSARYSSFSRSRSFGAAPLDLFCLMPHPPFPPIHNGTLSVIVPVYNEAATARAALDALLAKEIPGWTLQIIMIESNSTDGTRDIVLSYQSHPRVKIILEERARGKGHAVRAGFAAAT